MNRREPIKYKRVRKRLYLITPILMALFASVGGGVLSACRRDAGSTESGIQLAPASQLSEKVRGAPPVVQEAYRFAIANPAVLAKLPCYCGCGNMGHTSNLDCFVDEVAQDGSIVFGYHALA